ncbi:MAG: hypothetical protein NTZ26_08765 [Candidatus Aminicenantes bacterium]|nr:hypothetical protein [Candidatus Aminicenantes bacterium]
MNKPKNGLDNPAAEKLARAGEAPGPDKTIVGGRPARQETMIKGLPSGIQKLIISASMNDGIKASVVRNPSLAAKELQIELSDSESAILSSVPASQLIAMIEGRTDNPNIPRRGFLFETAAALAAVAASALGVTADAAQYPATQGISATRGISLDRPAVIWTDTLERAFLEAKKNSRPLLVVFLPRGEHPIQHLPTEAELRSEAVCELNGPDLRREISKNRLIPVRVTDEKVAVQYKMTVFPSVLFLSPDGAELGRVVQPKEELEILEPLLKAMAAYQAIPK